MIKNLNESDALRFKTLSPEEKKKKGILGRLFGPVASCVHATRNGRKYPEALWEKLFNSDLIKERFENGGIFGQLCHPDYEEVDMEKVACLMPEPPVRDKNGTLVTYVDIIDTPCGRIAYQLAKYGYKFGISSRGTGDLITGADGEEEVDPDTYQLNAFDLVEIPAVKEARLQFTESLDLDKTRYKKTLRQSLMESLDKATPEDREIMEDALKDFGIELELNKVEESVNDGDYTGWDESDIELHKNTDWAARNYKELPVPEDSFTSDAIAYRAGSEPESKPVKFIKYIRSNPIFPPYYGPEEKPFEGVVGPMFDGNKHGNYKIHDRYEDQKTYDLLSEKMELPEELVQKDEPDDTIRSDIDDNNEEVDNIKSDSELVAELQESLKLIQKLKQDNKSLQEKLSVCITKENSLNEQLVRYKKAVSVLSDSAKDKKKLTEKLNLSDKIIQRSKAELKMTSKLNKSLREKLENSKSEDTGLKEHVVNLNKQLEDYSKQLEESSASLEKYKKAYSALKECYIKTKAEHYGVDKSELLEKLGKSTKLKDVDRLCEELLGNRNRINKLPFKVDSGVKIAVKGVAKEPILGSFNDAYNDDFISESLIHMANL